MAETGAVEMLDLTPASAWERAVQELLRQAHRVAPHQLPGLLARRAAVFGVDDAVAYLADLQQTTLVPFLGSADAGTRELAALGIDGTVAGRAYQRVEVHTQPAGPRGTRVRLRSSPGCRSGWASPTCRGGGGGYPVATEHLQPGDRVVAFTDGVTEAPSPDGDRFGEERLVDLITRTLAGGLPAPETMRRLVRELLAHQQGQPTDDATLLMLERRTGGDQDLLPSPPAC